MKPLFVRYVERELGKENDQESRLKWLDTHRLIMAYLLWRTIKWGFRNAK
jgi:hypothetical protein